MSNTIAYVDNQTLVDIADAVRYKTGTNEKMLLSDIPDKIRNIEGIIPTGTQVITENGEYDVVGDKSVTVDVKQDTLYSLDLTKSIEDEIFGNLINNMTKVESGSDNEKPSITPIGLAFTEPTQRLLLGNFNMIGKTIEIDVASMDFQGSPIYHSRFFTNGMYGSAGNGLLIYNKDNGWNAYEMRWLGNWFPDTDTNKDRNLFNGKTVALKFYEDNRIELYLDGVLKGTKTVELQTTEYAIGACGSRRQDAGDQINNTVISAVRIKKNT